MSSLDRSDESEASSPASAGEPASSSPVDEDGPVHFLMYEVVGEFDLKATEENRVSLMHVAETNDEAIQAMIAGEKAQKLVAYCELDENELSNNAKELITSRGSIADASPEVTAELHQFVADDMTMRFENTQFAISTDKFFTTFKKGLRILAVMFAIGAVAAFWVGNVDWGLTAVVFSAVAIWFARRG